MSDEPVLTPITPEEGGAVPPKVAPFGAAPAPAAAPAAEGAATVKLKPVIRKPMIRKPVIGGAPKPPAPAATPAAAAPAAPAPAAAPAAPAAKKATANLKSVTGQIPAQAVLRKTGIIAEGVLTPAQQQAAKSKTSRISLESAIGVAPVKESAAPLKTIRLRRPTDLKPSPLKPVIKPAGAPAAETPVSTSATTVAAEPEADVTQKKTLKLQRPSGLGVKKPTLGIKKPEPAAADGGVADLTPVADLGDVPDLAPLPAAGGATSAGVPGWVSALSLAASVAALLAVGALVYFLYTEGVGPDAGPNAMAFIGS